MQGAKTPIPRARDDKHPVAGSAPRDADPPPRVRRGAASRDPRSLPIYDLYRQLRREMLAPADSSNPDGVVIRLLESLIELSREGDRLVTGGRAYRRLPGGYQLIAKSGDAGPAELGYVVPSSYRLIQELRHRGFVVAGPEDPRLDPDIEGVLGAHIFAAVVLGDAHDYVLSIALSREVDEDDVKLALASLASIADTALSQLEMLGSLGQAKLIQTSLLPSAPPDFAGYTVAFRAEPAEVVGGDVYDFQRIYGDGLGLCIGDACGHGLPAALQARDLVVGLRMAMKQNLKLVKTIDSLDQVMCTGSVAGRFISVFYAELDRDGTLIYVNAGHVPAILIRRVGCEVELLESSGPVLGLGFGAGRAFQRQFARLEPGDLLVLYTDGITEAQDPTGRELALDGLVDLVCRHRHREPQALVDAVFETLQARSPEPQADDRTMVVVHRELAPA